MVVVVGIGVGDNVGKFTAGDFIKEGEPVLADDLAAVAEADQGRKVGEAALREEFLTIVVLQAQTPRPGEVLHIGGIAVARVKVSDHQLRVRIDPSGSQRVGVGQVVGLSAVGKGCSSHESDVRVARAVDDHRCPIGCCTFRPGDVYALQLTRWSISFPGGKIAWNIFDLGARDGGLKDEIDPGFLSHLLEDDFFHFRVEADDFPGWPEEGRHLFHAFIDFILDAAGDAVVIDVDAAAGADAAEKSRGFEQRGLCSLARRGDAREGARGPASTDDHVARVGGRRGHGLDTGHRSLLLREARQQASDGSGDSVTEVQSLGYRTPI